MEHQLLPLLEYREILGAMTTSIDGLLVASVAVDPTDAELIAASTAGDLESPYRVLASEHGEIHVAGGGELRLIVLTERGSDPDRMRELVQEHLARIEESLHV